MSLATITAKAHLIPRDFGETFQARVTGDGATARYTLPRDNVEVSAAYLPGPPLVTLTSVAANPVAGQYTVDGGPGVITLGTPLANGAVLVVDGMAYVGLRPTHMDSYIDIAFQMHARGRLPVPTYDTLPPHEEYLVALLAVVEMLWALGTEAAQEIDVLTPEGVNIPRSQRFAQIMALIDRIMAHYKELAAAFNVGPYAIRVLTLRRVSRTTNRLVPIYIPQEFDDRTFPPVRVFPPLDTGLL